MSGLGLGGIAERGREEDFFPSVASFSESMGKCINQKQNRFQLAKGLWASLIRDPCTCPRFLSPLCGSRSEGVIGVQFLGDVRRRKQRKTLYLLNHPGTPKSRTAAGNAHVSLSQSSQTDLIQIPSSQEIYIGAALQFLV